MQRRACVAYRTLTPEDAAKALADEQREIADDWVAAERHYLSPYVSAITRPQPPVQDN